MRSLLHELPTATRRLARARGFSLTVVTFLGVAIAALLATAAAVYGLWLRPLPYPDADRLVEIRGYSRAMTFSLGLSAPLVAELPETYAAIEAYGPWERRRAEDGVSPAAISPGALAALGARAAVGRTFDTEHPEADGDAVLVSDALWASRWNRDPAAVGSTISYAGRERRVVGVMPAAFRFPDASVNLWLPLVLTPADTAPENAQVFGGMQVVAKLAPGGSAAALDTALRNRYDADPRIAGIRDHMKLAFESKPLREALAGSKAEVVGLLAAAAAIVLLTTLANLANLWLGRALARQRELALATALGATATRAGASVFAEVLLLTLAAGAGGVLLAPFALAGMRAAGVLEAGSALVVEIDAPMVGFAVAVAFAVSLALALPAWWLVRRVSGMDALRQGPTVVSDRPAVARARRALIAVQIAASVALLGAGGLLLRSLQAMVAEDAGFAREGTLLASVEPGVAPERKWGVPPTEAEVEAVRAFYDRVRSHPGLVASFANAAPFSGSESVATFLPPGKAVGEESAAKTRTVGLDYFRALGIPIVAGRDIDPANAEREVVVDEVFAARYLAPGDPLGQQIGFQDGPEDPLERATVVGVARTVKHAQLGERDEQGTFYVLQARPSDASLEVVARSTLPIADARAVIEREAAAAGLRVSRVATIDALIWRTLRERTALLGLVGGFALFGTALATLGLYAVLAFATRRRTAEYGLRLALGADTPRLAREVLRDALRIVLPGLVLGGAAGALAVRAIAGRLYGVGAGDPATWAAVAGTILVLVLLAASLPARRAARTDPMHALRNE